jgi:hypothetical protein
VPFFLVIFCFLIFFCLFLIFFSSFTIPKIMMSTKSTLATKTIYKAMLCLLLFFQISIGWAQYPSAQLGSKLFNNCPTGTCLQGESVALSGDGNMAIVGAPGDNNGMGSASIYTRSGSTWVLQMRWEGYNTWPGSDSPVNETVGPNVQFGYSVALSYDGRVAAVGAPGDNNNVGACFTWRRDGTTWTRTDRKFSTSGEGTRLGSSVAISGSGFRLAVGAPGFNNNTGAIFMGNGIGNNGSLGFFSYTGAPYSFGIPPILVGQAQFGSSVSFGKGLVIGGQPDRLIIGAPGDSNGIGAVWVYNSFGADVSGGIKLVPNGAVGAARQGTSVYLDSDFNTAIVGAPGDNNNTGAVWVYTFDGSTWTH